MLQNRRFAIGPSCLSAASGTGDLPDRQRQPGWLIVGAVARNSGKTELACAIVRAFRRTHAVVGVKVTAITEGKSICPRGGEGCGVCSAFEGDFQIAEETGGQPDKDTARLRASGASRVFWIRCRRQQIHAALKALAPRLGPGVLVVAESNSLARAIEPDLFLMVKDARCSSVKASAAEVMPLANRVVVSTDGVFDLSPRRHLAVVDGAWHLAEASAAILAGASSHLEARLGTET
ncbi:MAG: hypothetical protein A3H96_21215 [Acidobacteria bacterium RIFCSPLOWO2_02_FULL_67_36]|nr:MAG: hypothetical protein A3H96_21215 [Acidobacteria bacterium RIFCSPLOWO2_02_FULL_67_36]OFW21950.1 MAG: hypothetical protein A3G21_08785 [Acidobacteria bacterium RIFCSPLOWO2_12_FULL_66_21]